MAKHTINILLSEKPIDEAIGQLQQYKNWLIKKTSQLVKELAEAGIPVIDENMEKASYTYDEKGVRSGSDTSHYTHVKVQSFGGYSKANLIVQGKELMFIEFGAGVFCNGAAGSSPHPKGAVNGMVIGSYGNHHGVQKVWGYYADSGELVLTHGVEAQMPVYKADMEIIQKYVEVARRVFS